MHVGLSEKGRGLPGSVARRARSKNTNFPKIMCRIQYNTSDSHEDEITRRKKLL